MNLVLGQVGVTKACQMTHLTKMMMKETRHRGGGHVVDKTSHLQPIHNFPLC